MFPKFFYQLILPKLYLENIAWKLSLSRALEFKVISALILRGLEFDIPVYSNYTGRKHQGFE